MMSSASSSNVETGFARYTIAERPLSHRQMTSFRQREGAFLLKTPDLVLADFDAPRSITIVDIKIVDPAAASYVKSTAKSALQGAIVPWRLPAPVTITLGHPGGPPPGALMRVVTFIVSTFDSLGACSSSSPHQRHRQTHQPLRAFFTCP